MWRIAVVAALIVVQAPSTGASAPDWWFKTPGGAAYCGFVEVGGWLCMRPKDGFWIRLTGVLGNNPDVRTGYSREFLGFKGPAARVLRFGEFQYSSDAQAITCWSHRTNVTCKQFAGLSFSLGRERGYRIFWDAPGFPPNVAPLFQTGHGIRCGINDDNLEPANPILNCWRPADGLVLGIAHDNEGRRGSHGRSEKAMGFRPPGFRLLAYGGSFEWRCRDVTSHAAERCSTRVGTPVFACTSTRARLTCMNRDRHGFWASIRSFYTF